MYTPAPYSSQKPTLPHVASADCKQPSTVSFVKIVVIVKSFRLRFSYPGGLTPVKAIGSIIMSQSSLKGDWMPVQQLLAPRLK